MSNSKLHPCPSFKRSHSDLSRSTTPVPTENDFDNITTELPAFLNQSQNDLRTKFTIIQEIDKKRLESFVEQNQDPGHPWALELSREVLIRNRYSDVQPWSKSRIHLRVQDGEADYINASPIKLVSTDGKRELQYVAAQGPKNDGVNHFWQMVWHECGQTVVIVMLTQLNEGFREKCFQYFPSERDLNLGLPRAPLSRAPSRANTPPAGNTAPLSTSPARSHLLSPGRISTSSRSSNSDPSTATQPFLSLELTSSRGEPTSGRLTLIDTQFDETTQSTIRKFSLTCENEARVVYHLLFSGWPDYGVPQGSNREAMLSLIHLSNERNCSGEGTIGPRVVHCSAGVGRTGTFIALEHLLAELDSGAWDLWDDVMQKSYEKANCYQGNKDSEENTKEIPGAWPDPVFDTVSRLREQRANMVQSSAQFLFLYEILSDEWIKRRRGILEDKLSMTEPSSKALRLGAGLKKMLNFGKDRGNEKEEREKRTRNLQVKQHNDGSNGSGTATTTDKENETEQGRRFNDRSGNATASIFNLPPWLVAGVTSIALASFASLWFGLQ